MFVDDLKGEIALANRFSEHFHETIAEKEVAIH